MTHRQVDEQLDFSRELVASSTLRYMKLLPSSQSQSMTITSAVSGFSFQLPTSVVANLSRSILTFSATFPATAPTSLNFVYSGLLPLSSIQLMTNTGKLLDEVQYLDMQTEVLGKTDLKFDDVLNNPVPVSATGATATLGMGFAIANVAATSNIRPYYSATNSGRSYAQVQYCWGASDMTNGGDTITYNIPLGLIRDSLFAVDRMVPLSEACQLNFQFVPQGRFGFSSTSATAPTIANSTAYAQSISINGITLFLGCEQNESVKQQLFSQVSGGGLKMTFPHTQSVNNQPSGTAISTNISIPKSWGSNLQKVVHTCVPLTTGQEYNRAVAPHNTTTAPLTYNAYLNNVLLHDANLSIADGSAYREILQPLDGSLYTSQADYLYRWVDYNDFTNQKRSTDFVPNELRGIPIPDSGINWSWQATMAGSGQMSHYDFVITQKTLVADKSGLIAV